MPKTVVPLCRNPQQGLCTVDCPYRSTCQVSRVPFLIHAVVIHYKKNQIYGDDYINDLVKLRCSALNDVCHQGGIDLKEKIRPNISLEGV